MQSVRTIFFGSALYHMALARPTRRAPLLRLPTPWPGDKARGQAMLAGTFSFAGETMQTSLPPWDAERPNSWRAELHRFDWLADLAAHRGGTAAKAAREWTADWVRRYDIYEPLAWRADVMGDRLFAWLEHFEIASGGDTSPERAAFVASFARQARHLAHVAVHEAPGLARLKALRGLVAAAAALRARHRLSRALRELAREVEIQIMPDGAHRSRSPAGQVTALRCLVDARATLVAADRPVPDFLTGAIERAAPLLRFYRHGDGGLALFNGADAGNAGFIDLVLARADAPGRAPPSAGDAHYERLQAGGTAVLVDCGMPPLPGFDRDAHAGALSFEISHGRERIIVNCGAHQGLSVEWRLAMRATAAHSTVIVADTNSAELLPAGGIGKGPRGVTSERAEKDGDLWLSATHDGYREAFGLTHGRQLFLAADGDDLRGEDALTGPAGRGFAVRFHLHPDVEATLQPEGNTVRLTLPSGGAWRLRAEGAVLSLGESIYQGDGAPRKTQQVLLDGHVGTQGATVRWAIRREVD